jgi:hypothetical protein
MNTNPTTIYCLFQTVGDADNRRHDILLGLFTSVELAKQHCRTLPHTLLDVKGYESEEDDQPVHESMNLSNGYTYVGQRSDCDPCIGHECFGGYIIEPMTVNTPTINSTPTYLTGFDNPVLLSDDLATFLGKDKGTILTRLMVNQLIRMYVQDHNLSGVMWRYDEALFRLLGKTKGDDLGYFNMHTAIQPHLTYLNPEQVDRYFEQTYYQKMKTECDEYSAKIHELCRPLLAKQEELHIEYEDTTEKYDEELGQYNEGDPTIEEVRVKYNTILDGIQDELDRLHCKLAGYHMRIYEMRRSKCIGKGNDTVVKFDNNQCKYCKSL